MARRVNYNARDYGTEDYNDYDDYGDEYDQEQ